MQSESNYTISIVIAMYNIEKYIQYCLESCASQLGVKDSDYEVIVINDGSTDSSLEIAESFSRDRHNFRVVCQNNAGLSSARNAGLNNAKGEYVWFVDGDDAIANNAISILKSSIRSSGADAYLFNFSTFDGVRITDTSSFKSFPSISGKQIHDKYLTVLPMMAWLTVYRRDALLHNDLFFLPGIYHEDFEFSVRAHHRMKKICFLDNPLYYYRTDRKDSIMNKVGRDNTKSLSSELSIIDSFSSFFEGEDTKFVRILLGMSATAFMVRRFDSAFVTNEITSRLLRDNKLRLYKLMWRSGQWKRRLLLIGIVLLPRRITSLILSYRARHSRLM